jgi:hypothetical protein
VRIEVCLNVRCWTELFEILRSQRWDFRTSTRHRRLHRQRHHRILREEIERPDHKVVPHHRHHRPIFRARHVMKSRCVPRHNVRVLDRIIGLGPNSKSLVPLSLDRVHARCAKFVRTVRSDSQLVIGKSAHILHPVRRRLDRPEIEQSGRECKSYVEPQRLVRWHTRATLFQVKTVSSAACCARALS